MAGMATADENKRGGMCEQQASAIGRKRSSGGGMRNIRMGDDKHRKREIMA